MTVRCTLESTTGYPSTRRFSGTIVGNKFRAGNRPIQLRSADNERAKHADAGSPLSLDTGTNSLTIMPRPEGDALVGEDRWFVYVFENAETLKAHTLKSEDVSQAEDGGQRTETQRTDDRRQTTDPELPVVTNRATSDRAIERSTDMPSYPTAAGAYVLSDGLWKPLPGQDVHALRTAAAVVRGLGQVLSNLNIVSNVRTQRGIGAAADILDKLTFDGAEPVPTAAAKNVVVVYVGPPARPTASDIARDPELRTYPVMEMAPATVQPTGARSISLIAIAPGLAGFSSGRVAATVEQPKPDVTVLRASAAIPKGHYVVLAGGKGFEVAAE